MISFENKHNKNTIGTNKAHIIETHFKKNFWNSVISFLAIISVKYGNRETLIAVEIIPLNKFIIG